tara:strand:- start:13622 stop:14434 length:813 start_codon:yes stop_codon:yes gene_type:complete
VKDKVALITGGTGSLGKVVADKMIGDGWVVRVLTNSEAELVAEQWDDKSKLRFLIGDIRDRERMYRAMDRVDTVIHTAALKHVPVCEYNPIEAVKTNILGSINIIDAALDRGVKRVIAISSDKAVHPINLYGATKLTMEKLVTQANVYGKTKFSCVRFGNFRSSRGNVLNLWYKQIEQGLPITVTEKGMTRFWITLEKAADFVTKCVGNMTGGEVFIPKMPEENLMELAEQMAGENGLTFIGKRPGEKLHELLFNEGEQPETHDGYFVVR